MVNLKSVVAKHFCLATTLLRSTINRKMIYIFVWIQHGCLANMVFALGPSNSVIKRLWCMYL